MYRCIADYCEVHNKSIFSLVHSSGYLQFLSEGTETPYMEEYLVLPIHKLAPFQYRFRYVTLAPPRYVSSLLAKVSTQPLTFLGPYGGWLPR